MTRRTGLLPFAAVCAAILMLPALAGAASRNVYAGGPPQTNAVAKTILSKNFVSTYNPDVNSFFSHRTTISAGGTVSFHLNGFHTVDLAPKGKGDVPFIVPSGGIASSTDAAGNPFWFSGVVPILGVNPALFGPSGGHTYNGSSRVDSGIGATKPFNVKFTKPGVYKFYCDVHPGMVGYVVVKAKGAKIPSARQNTANVTSQITADIKVAKALATEKVPKHTVYLGRAASDGIELYMMFPDTLKVKSNTTVTFAMSAFTRETHTATFGPPSYLGSISKAFQGAPTFPAVGVYPSSPSSIVVTPTSHGNGFANTGALDRDPSTPLPASRTIDFTTPGTYHYQCLIHPFMHGTIIVH